MINYAGHLRLELRQRALAYAQANDLPHYLSNGPQPTVLFPTNAGRNGNFIDASYRAILEVPQHAERIQAAHPRRNALPAPHCTSACELDSSNSSDALLMNVFCFPGAGSSRLSELLGIPTWSDPAFGIRSQIPGEPPNRWQWTELDMTVGARFHVEAKLTETDFTTAEDEYVTRYSRFADVFHPDRLGGHENEFEDYQLIRNVLAADLRNGRFVLLYDDRRPDLLARWHVVHHAVRDPGLRARCAAICWQEIALAAPTPLQGFLALKYGIGA